MLRILRDLKKTKLSYKIHENLIGVIVHYETQKFELKPGSKFFTVVIRRAGEAYLFTVVIRLHDNPDVEWMKCALDAFFESGLQEFGGELLFSRQATAVIFEFPVRSLQTHSVVDILGEIRDALDQLLWPRLQKCASMNSRYH